MGPPDPADSALLDLLQGLDEEGYSFVTVTPETHRKTVSRRAGTGARDLRDVFGWSLPFEAGVLPQRLEDALERSGMTERDGGRRRSGVRVSSLGGRLFLHSAYPTDAADAVFLGPDSYRFAAFLGVEIPALGPVRRLVDIGAGAGVGAAAAAALLPGARLTLADVNPLALRFARLNLRHAGLAGEVVESDGLAAVEGPFDLAIANPPFMADPAGRAYRDGGGLRGAGLSLAWALDAIRRMDAGGTILLYTGSAIVAGRDVLREALEAELAPLGGILRYAEIDPDIFGEQLGEPGYEEVERIAAVGAVIRKAR